MLPSLFLFSPFPGRRVSPPGCRSHPSLPRSTFFLSGRGYFQPPSVLSQAGCPEWPLWRPRWRVSGWLLPQSLEPPVIIATLSSKRFTGSLSSLLRSLAHGFSSPMIGVSREMRSALKSPRWPMPNQTLKPRRSRSSWEASSYTSGSNSIG